ncbi:MAG: hypothetical protein KKD18_06635, partial [Nanoarchaeota archaeon]|nr:hypothetical protein [Nanoarchaeota archaeon]
IIYILQYTNQCGGFSKLSIEISLANTTGVISGTNAESQIALLDYKGNSGVRGLYRGTGGGWRADRDDLPYSDADGRVDRVCGEATAQILLQAHDFLIERNYGEKMRAEKRAFKEALSR